MISGGGGGGEKGTGTVRLEEDGRGGTGGALRREEARSEAARAARSEAMDPLALREREGGDGVGSDWGVDDAEVAEGSPPQNERSSSIAVETFQLQPAPATFLFHASPPPPDPSLEAPPPLEKEDLVLRTGVLVGEPVEPDDAAMAGSCSSDSEEQKTVWDVT